MRAPTPTPTPTERAFTDGYFVDPVDNGGFVVRATGARDSGMIAREVGAFTNAADLIAFLAEGHGVKRR